MPSHRWRDFLPSLLLPFLLAHPNPASASSVDLKPFMEWLQSKAGMETEDYILVYAPGDRVPEDAVYLGYFQGRPQDAYRLDLVKPGKPRITEDNERVYVLIFIPRGFDFKDFRCEVTETQRKPVPYRVAAPYTPPKQSSTSTNPAPSIANLIETSMSPDIKKRINAIIARLSLPFYCAFDVSGKGDIEVAFKITRVVGVDLQCPVRGGQAECQLGREIFNCPVSGTQADCLRGKEKFQCPIRGAAAECRVPIDKLEFGDKVRVRYLYRFRVIAGPVYSRLKAKDKKFDIVTDQLGQRFVSSSAASDVPVNYPLFLKVYWLRTDVYDPKWWQRVLPNPVVGVNLFNGQFKNFYVGGSIEPFVGLDVVAGFHWARITRLAGGFRDGEVITNPAINMLATEQKFDKDFFIGIAVDVGVLGEWLNNTVLQGLRNVLPQ